MKQLVLVFFAIISMASYAQLSDLKEAQSFWDNNIVAITTLDIEKIVAQTNFPLEIDKNEKKTSLTSSEFRTRIKEFFNESVISQLKTQSINNIDAWVMSEDVGQTYMIVCFLEDPSFDAVVFSFKQFDGSWKLYAINYQKE